MANTITAGLKSTAVDVAQRLQRAGDAIVSPHRLGAGALDAFKTLSTLTKLADLLPAKMQPLVKGLLSIGLDNVGRVGDPTAKDAVRGYTSMLAIKSGRVPVEVLDRAAGPQQRDALIDAARRGDTATVKSILRHNKKQGTSAPPSPVVTPGGTIPGAKPAVDVKAGRDLAARQAQYEAGKAHFAGRPGSVLPDARGLPVHIAPDGTATRLNDDKTETKLAGKALGDYILHVAGEQQRLRTDGGTRRGGPSADDLEMLRKLEELLQMLRKGAGLG